MSEDRKPTEPLEDDVDEGAEATEGGKGAPRFVTDTVRKAFLAGVGALFMTEEGARRLAREWKLPKDVLNFVTAQASGAKDEVLRVMSEEMRRFFQSESLRREFVKLLGSMSVEIHAEIRLKDAGGGQVKTNVHKAIVKPRVGKRQPEPEPEPEDPGPARTT